MKKRMSNRMSHPRTILTTVCFLFVVVTSMSAQTWTQTSAPTNLMWNALACSSDGRTLLAVEKTGLYTSTNSGSTWTQAQVPSPFWNTWRAGSVSADGVKMTAGDYGGIYTSTNSGQTWLLSTNGPGNYWFSIACSADGTHLVAAPYCDTNAGNAQPLYISTNSGATWTAAITPSNHWVAAASSADGENLFALASNGPIYLSTNSGISWISNNTTAYWSSIACSADGTKAVAVAGQGEVYTWTQSGAAWVPHFVSGVRNGFGSVASSADGERLLAVGSGNGSPVEPIFISTNSGESWIPQSNAPPLVTWNAVTCSADGHEMFAATYGLVLNDYAGGIYILQTIPSPALNLTSGTNPTLSWIPPSTNFVLQQNLDLATTNWETLPNAPILNFSNLQYQVILPFSNSSAFYRLVTP